jgi:hypothetical protein
VSTIVDLNSKIEYSVRIEFVAFETAFNYELVQEVDKKPSHSSMEFRSCFFLREYKLMEGDGENAIDFYSRQLRQDFSTRGITNMQIELMHVLHIDESGNFFSPQTYFVYVKPEGDDIRLSIDLNIQR